MFFLWDGFPRIISLTYFGVLTPFIKPVLKVSASDGLNAGSAFFGFGSGLGFGSTDVEDNELDFVEEEEEDWAAEALALATALVALSFLLSSRLALATFLPVIAAELWLLLRSLPLRYLPPVAFAMS